MATIFDPAKVVAPNIFLICPDCLTIFLTDKGDGTSKTFKEEGCFSGWDIPCPNTKCGKPVRCPTSAFVKPGGSVMDHVFFLGLFLETDGNDE
jgi:hypothetical protein